MNQAAKYLFSIEEACVALDIKRTTMHYLMTAKLIEYVQIGSHKKIPASELERISKEGISVIPKPEKKALVG